MRKQLDRGSSPVLLCGQKGKPSAERMKDTSSWKEAREIMQLERESLRELLSGFLMSF